MALPCSAAVKQRHRSGRDLLDSSGSSARPSGGISAWTKWHESADDQEAARSEQVDNQDVGTHQQ